jgi:diguanylate cyclase (GGDEF)-like protein/PAS domain S-box-containing protein
MEDDQRRAEETLRRSEEKFRATFEHAPLGICHIALDGRVLLANQTLADMFGYPLDELYTLTPRDVIYAEDIPGDVEGAEQLLSGQAKVFRREKRHLRKDGAIVWSDVTSTLLHDERGEPLYFIATVDDITERKRTEAALREREQQFRATFEQAAVGVGHVAMDGHWLRVNQKLCDILGYTMEELTAMTYRDVTHPADMDIGPHYLKQVGQGQADTKLIEKRYMRKDGRIAWVEIAAAPVRDAHGNLLYVIAFIEDITQRKQAEQAQSASEERYRATYEHAPVGIAHTDLTGHWQQVNDRLCQVLGYSREELLQMSFQDITYPEDLPRQLEAVRKLLSGETDTYTMEKRYFHKGGSVVWAELTGAVIRDCAGQPDYFIAVLEDITARKQAEDALLASEEQFRTIFEHAAEGIAQVGLDGKWLRVNQALCRIVGYTRQELLHRTFQEMTHPDDLDKDLVQFGRLLAGEISSYSIEKRYIRKNRTRVWADLTVSLVRDRDGKPMYAISMIEDITRRKQAEEAMRRAEEHFRLLVEGAEDYAIIRLDEYGNIASWNPGAEKILGYREEEIIGQHFSHLHTPEDVAQGEPQRKLSRAIRDGRAEDDRWRARKDGSRFWGSSVINALYDDEGNVQGFVKIMRDMSEQRLHQEKAAFLAHHDPLTGLPNRAYFSDRLHEAIVHAERDGTGVALHLLDLDRFKSVNDTLGHHVGDLLLKEVANRLRTCVRETDTVARLGGDEFTVIQTNVTREEDAAFLAEKIGDALEVPYDLEGQEVHSGTSIGVTLYARDAQDSVQLLKNADLALYRAKECGRHNYQFFTADLHAVLLNRQQMEQDLRRALTNQEFSLYYQPQIDLVTWNVCGVEALLRWRNPQLQMLTPGEFMDIAQETGLIVPIGEWVLREACRQNKAWQDAGIPFFRIGVNFSARQIHDPEFVGMIRRVLAETGLSPTCLELEINESQFMKDREATQAILAELSALDIRISTDDFGAALSNLNLLCQFPMDTLKIDRRVIEHVAHRKQDRAMAAAVINLANDLDVRVIAEGVETLEQLAFLQEKGCRAAQGFLFSPPVSAHSLEVLLRAGTWSRMNPIEEEG